LLREQTVVDEELTECCAISYLRQEVWKVFHRRSFRARLV
jgi:hypothetical protein